MYREKRLHHLNTSGDSSQASPFNP
jgi:hypothetical protein